MKNHGRVFACIAVLMMTAILTSPVPAEESTEVQEVVPEISIREQDPVIVGSREAAVDEDISVDVYFDILNTEMGPGEPEYSASIPGTAGTVTGVTDETWYNSGCVTVNLHLSTMGLTALSVKIADKTAVVPVAVLPYGEILKKISVSGYRRIKAEWTQYNGMTGWLLQRKLSDSDDYQTIASFPAAVSEGEAEAPLNMFYYYRMVPFITINGVQYTSEQDYRAWFEEISFKAGIPGTLLRSVSVKGDQITLAWDVSKDVDHYDIFRAGADNGIYKKIASVKGKGTWSQKVKKGAVYCYKVKAVYPDGNAGVSNSLSQFVSKKGKASFADVKKTDEERAGQGQYSGNWAKPDRIGYYVSGENLYVVCAGEDHRTLKIYGINHKDKVVSKKKVRLPKKYDVFGGFYHGEDNRNYVAVGYANLKESKTKTVIQVFQYDKKWKKLKTASVKGGAGNVFEGIYRPFEAASTSFAMKGSTLYFFTGRQMFIHSDGLRHQSNISFAINTQTMEVKEANENYASHSFNQRARFKDGSLYLMDHGDAFPRSIELTTVRNYGADENPEITSDSVFDFLGKTGENYTGCKVAGMEVGADHVLIAGTALPHHFRIKGKTGINSDWEKNLFVTVTDLNTGKTTVNWLTKYAPNRKNKILGEARLVKISDYRFAVLVSIDQVLHYFAVDQNGKKVAHKKYKKIPFSASTQPVLYKGMITWREDRVASEYTYNTKKNKWEAVDETPARICRIPVE